MTSNTNRDNQNTKHELRQHFKNHKPLKLNMRV